MNEIERLRKRVESDRHETNSDFSELLGLASQAVDKYNVVSAILEAILCMLAATPDHPANAKIREYIDAELSRL